MHVRKILILIVILLLAGTLGYEFAVRRGEDQSPIVVRTYQVAPERAVELKNQLNRLFWMKEGDGGTAQVFGSGLVLVRAPIGYQNGVQALVERLADQPIELGQRIRIDYYLVLAQSLKSGTSSEVPRALAPVFASIEKLDGPSRFRVLEHMVTTSVTGDETAADGAMLKSKSSTSVYQGRLQVKLELDSWFGKVRTNVDLQNGEYLVLGQNAQRLDDQRTKAFGEGTVYYILRAELQK